MAKAVRHKGRVVSRKGQGVASALVAVARGTAPTPEIGICCDQQGYFQIALPPGRYVLEARAPDGKTGSVEIVTDEVSLAVEIVL